MPATVRRCRAARPSPSPRSTTPKSSSSTRNNNPPSRTREGKSHRQRSHPNDQGSRSLLFVLRPYRADGPRGCRGRARRRRRGGYPPRARHRGARAPRRGGEIGSASGRDYVWHTVVVAVVTLSLTNKYI